MLLIDKPADEPTSERVRGLKSSLVVQHFNNTSSGPKFVYTIKATSSEVKLTKTGTNDVWFLSLIFICLCILFQNL